MIKGCLQLHPLTHGTFDIRQRPVEIPNTDLEKLAQRLAGCGEFLERRGHLVTTKSETRQHVNETPGVVGCADARHRALGGFGGGHCLGIKLMVVVSFFVGGAVGVMVPVAKNFASAVGSSA